MQILVASVTAIIGLVLIGAIKWADAKRALKDLIDGFKKIQDSYEGTPSDQVSLIKDWVFEVNSTDFKMLSPKDLIRHYQLTGYSLGRPLVKLEDTMAKKIGKRSRGMLNFLAFLSKIAPLFVAIGMTIAFIAIILAIDSLLGYPIIRGLTGL